MPRVKSFLYAVRMLIPGVEVQPVKVGFSTSPDKRRLSYNSGPYPCEWLGVWPGNLQDELEFHMRFYELNRQKGLIGEWFLPNAEFLRTINKKIEAYRRETQRQAERAAIIEATRAQREAEQAVIDKEMRVRAAQIMEDWVGMDALKARGVEISCPLVRRYWRMINEETSLLFQV